MTRADRGPVLLIVGGVLMILAVVAYLIRDAEDRQSAIMAARPASPTLSPYFSPHGGCTEAIVGLIGSARRRVCVQAYSFTSRPIADALIAAHRRGIDVAIVLDRGQRTAPGSLGGECAEAGIPVAYDGKHAIAHNKLLIVDGKAVSTGSFNLSAAAEGNAENVLIVRDTPTAAAYEANWTEHRGHSEP